MIKKDKIEHFVKKLKLIESKSKISPKDINFLYDYFFGNSIPKSIDNTTDSIDNSIYIPIRDYNKKSREGDFLLFDIKSKEVFQNTIFDNYNEAVDALRDKYISFETKIEHYGWELTDGYKLIYKGEIKLINSLCYWSCAGFNSLGYGFKVGEIIGWDSLHSTTMEAFLLGFIDTKGRTYWIEKENSYSENTSIIEKIEKSDYKKIAQNFYDNEEYDNAEIYFEKYLHELDNSYYNEEIDEIQDMISYCNMFKNYEPNYDIIDQLKEESNSNNKFIYTNYDSIPCDKLDNYPILKFPVNNCIVKSFKYTDSKVKGYLDESFSNSLKEYFRNNDFEISNNIKIETGYNTRPYQPDIAIIISSDKNIRIDVEIDEPYSSFTRKPIHCIGDDDNRDEYFRNRGWIVMRFTERQIHLQKQACLKLIAEILIQLDNNLQTPQKLKQADTLNDEKRWNSAIAQRFEKTKYREKYLESTFLKNVYVLGQNEIHNEYDDLDEEEDKLVKNSLSHTIEKNKSFNITNLNKRDYLIKFQEELHSYFVNDVPFKSATSIIDSFFPVFDKIYRARVLKPSNDLFGLEVDEIIEIWNEKAKISKEKGTFLHQQIESYLLGESYSETDEFYQFKNFIKEQPGLNFFRSEWRIYDEEYRVAGTVDLVVKNPNGHFDIYDWKRSKKVVDCFNLPNKIKYFGEIGYGMFKNTFNTSYNKYELQQNLYKYILENRYNMKIDNMYLVVMHSEELDDYIKIRIDEKLEEVEYILENHNL